VAGGVFKRWRNLLLRLKAMVQMELNFILVHSIQDLSNESKLRKDLIYRINTVEIIIPPLRNRKEDVVPLANYFLEVYSQKYLKPPTQLHQSAI
jgi:DNA-binding NtrC family response regulator